ncbi:MAG: BRO family protein [Anaerotignaceae bacterium]
MYKLEIFENQDFGQVRTLIIDDVPWFVGKDVATILQYSNTAKAVSMHVDMEDRKNIMLPYSQNGNMLSRTTIINESGLYSLILSSKLPKAKKFKHWVTAEILPSIRKYGGYITWHKMEDMLNNPDRLSEFLRQMLRVTEENKKLKNHIEELEPKASYFNTLVDNNLLINFRTTAKELGIKPMRFTQFLLDKKYVYRDKKQRIYPVETYVHDGIFVIKEYCRNGHCGTQTLITPKGRKYFLEEFSKSEII